MKYSHKKIVASVALVIVVLVVVELAILYYKKSDIQVCGGVANLSCPEGFRCDSTHPNSVDDSGVCVPFEDDVSDLDNVGDDLVEYSPAYGDPCPVGVKFISSRSTEPVACACPEGYELDSVIIGGELCYDGAECPILSVECVPVRAE